MIYTTNSFTVKFYSKKVRDGELTLSSVPNLFNLREMVGLALENK